MSDRPTISKTRFIGGCQCARRLWLETYRPELGAAPDFETRERFGLGTQFGVLAREQYPGGTLIGATQNAAACRATDQALSDAFVPAIYEAALQHEDVVVRADILARADLGSWDLIEVKSSRSAREVYVLDLALQYWVARGAGVRIRRAGLLLLAEGASLEKLEGEGLCAFTDLSAECERRLPEIGERVAFFHEVLSGRYAPEAAMGEHCHAPYDCPFLEHCRLQG